MWEAALAEQQTGQLSTAHVLNGSMSLHEATAIAPSPNFRCNTSVEEHVAHNSQLAENLERVATEHRPFDD